MVAVVAIINWSADTIANFIPFSYEQELSSSWGDELDAGNSQVKQSLQDLADELSVAMQLPDDMPITLHYQAEEDINAFATLGGHIVIYRGLLENAPSENALAMVLAHEIAHVKHRDPIVAMGRGVLVGTALAVVTGASGDDVGGTLLGGAGLLTGLHFGREQESDADREALAALYRHYGHVNGSTTIFEHFRAMEDEQGFSMPELFSTHPISEGRIDDLVHQAQKHGWSRQGPLQPLSDVIRKEVETGQPER